MSFRTAFVVKEDSDFNTNQNLIENLEFMLDGTPDSKVVEVNDMGEILWGGCLNSVMALTTHESRKHAKDLGLVKAASTFSKSNYTKSIRVDVVQDRGVDPRYLFPMLNKNHQAKLKTDIVFINPKHDLVDPVDIYMIEALAVKLNVDGFSTKVQPVPNLDVNTVNDAFSNLETVKEVSWKIRDNEAYFNILNYDETSLLLDIEATGWDDNTKNQMIENLKYHNLAKPNKIYMLPNDSTLKDKILKFKDSSNCHVVFYETVNFRNMISSMVKGIENVAKSTTIRYYGDFYVR